MKSRLPWRGAILALFAIASFSQLSCKLNDYCLECGKGDASPIIDAQPIDSQVDARDANPCVPTGLPEECNGKDDDCNGLIDDNVPTIGDPCSNQMGECAGGKITCDPTFHCSVTITTACIDANDTISCPTGELCKADDKSTDHLSCDKRPTPEVCDNKDNNCNGTIDEGDPSDTVHAAGARCGNGTGTCVQGTYHCTGLCVGQADGCTAGTDVVTCTGGTGPGTESCDGLDNDCDGMIDNNITGLGTCGTSTVGVCTMGTNQCVGGNIVCQGAVNPGFETCNNMDDDCDNKTDENFKDASGVYNLTAQNCGGCNQICGSSLTNGGNANWTCTTAGTCAIASCKSGYHDNNNDPSDGCEFGVCFVSGPEQCDGVDNDCDGTIDETGTGGIGAAPAICATTGECKGSTAACPCANTADTGCTGGGTCTTTCSNMAGWTCNYPSTVSVVNGVIQDETTCDGLDNDCNGVIDDNQAEMKHTTCAGYVVGSPSSCPFTAPACGDSNLGECHGTGTYQCDSANKDGAAKCNITSPGATAANESCNNKDDDCDGATDEGTNLGNLDGPSHNDQLWVDIGGGHQMMKYEASRPDADGTTAGNVSATTCAKLTIAASPSGATETSTTVTITTNVPHGLKTGDRVVIANVAAGGAYDGTFYVTGVPSSTTFTYTTTSGLTASGGGTVGIHCPISITGASESGSTVTITTGVDHALSVGQSVIIAGVTNTGYNGTYVITSVPTTKTFKYTSSSTGLGSSSGGTVAANAVATCSKSGALPWTNVTYPQALAACQAVGATLCTDQEWHRSCSANASGGNLPTTYPVTYGGTGVLIEAEDYFNNSYATDGTGTTRSWVEDTTAGFFGISDMIAQPNTGASITSGNAPSQAPRLDYQVTFGTTSTNYHVCVHMYANSANDNSIFVGVNSTLPGTANSTALANACSTYPCWNWIASPALSITANTSPQFVSLYMAQDGVKVDALFVVNGSCPAGLTNSSENGTVNGKGFQWAMQPTPNYTSNVCNDQNYTGTGSGAAISTGSLASCYADDSGLKSGSTSQRAFDMSGNVREWTLSHQPGQNPIRGGAFTDTKIGVDCPNNFLLADDKFFLPNIGFRCCR